MSLKLTKAQLAALKALAAREKGSAHELGLLGVGALNVIVARGYAQKSPITNPRTAIIYRITDAGRAALASATGGTK